MASRKVNMIVGTVRLRVHRDSWDLGQPIAIRWSSASILPPKLATTTAEAP
eukprot:CAMPEP_0173467436 /NCGR_PEP_ID=MMETSP1357-20121228/75051_1 /TAXON_ID=77926 /ORGANISM="Hemiselmis rufescens, Strain PCC563" /LENGTH=50 /DNA_ID=CAMNT_0014435569 /DNA_START=64 /DNA_END=213 /DNA_ORIENTATION=+